MKKLLPPILFLLCLLLIAVLSHFMPIARVIGHPFNLIGIGLFIAGLGIAIAGNRHFAKVGTNIYTFDDPDILVSDGLFSFSRNPMYLGFCLALVGAALFSATLSSLLVAIGFAAITDRYYIQFEEKRMRHNLGLNNLQNPFCALLLVSLLAPIISVECLMSNKA